MELTRESPDPSPVGPSVESNVELSAQRSIPIGWGSPPGITHAVYAPTWIVRQPTDGVPPTLLSIAVAYSRISRVWDFGVWDSRGDRRSQSPAFTALSVQSATHTAAPLAIAAPLTRTHVSGPYDGCSATSG